MYTRYIPPAKSAQQPPADSNRDAASATKPVVKPSGDGLGYSRFIPGAKPQNNAEKPSAPPAGGIQRFDDEPTSPAPKRKRDTAEDGRDAHQVDSKKLKKANGSSKHQETSEEKTGNENLEAEAPERTRRRRRRRKSDKDGGRSSPGLDEGAAEDFDGTEQQANEDTEVDPMVVDENETRDEAEKKPKDKKDRKEKKEKKKKSSKDKSEPSEAVETAEDADEDVPMADVDRALSPDEQPPVSDDVDAAKVKKPKRKKKEKERPQDTTLEEEDDGELEKRHKMVLERKAKSLKLASEMPRDTGDDAVDEGELHGLEPLPQPEPTQVDTSKPAYETLPSWLAAPIRVAHDQRIPFTDLGILPKAARVLEEKGFKDAFAVQTAAIPLLLPTSKTRPGDLLISAATGSGKTLAYALPIVRDLSQGRVTRLKALVVLPTRELVKQAQEVFELCAKAFEGSDRKKVRVGIAIGSQALRNEQDVLVDAESRYDPEAYQALREELREKESLDPMAQDTDPRLGRWDGEVVDFQSKVDVLICTPGRLVEHLEQTSGFSLDYVRWLVVDEADKLLAQSFQGWLETVMEKFQVNKFGARDFPDMNLTGVRKVILSATLTRDLSLLSQLALRRPQLIVLDRDGQSQVAEHSLPALLQEHAIRVHNSNLKPLYLLDLLRSGEMSVKDSAADGAGDVAVAETSDSDTSSSSDSESDSDSDSGSDTSSDSDDTSSDGSDSDSDSDSDAGAKSKPASPNGKIPIALIFTKSNESALRLSRLLVLLDKSLEPHVSTLTSTTPTHIRRKTLRAFTTASSPVRLIVASDLVARGIDLPNLDHVVNYDLPPSVAGYVHRVGRTARAGRSGSAWTLVGDDESGWFWGKIAKGAGVRRAQKVERTRIEEMSEERVEEYEAALEKLGAEAVEMRKK